MDQEIIWLPDSTVHQNPATDLFKDKKEKNGKMERFLFVVCVVLFVIAVFLVFVP